MATNNALNNDLTNCSGLIIPGGITATGTPSAATFLNGANAWAVPAGKLINVQVLTTTGGTTYAKTAGTVSIIVILIGGGGGGGGAQGSTSTSAAAAGGTAGGCVQHFIASAPSTSNISIGAGGAGGTNVGGTGTNGGGTTWAVGSLSAGQGAGGSGMLAIANTTSSTSRPLTTGTSSGGNILNLKGAPGSPGFVVTGLMCSGNGGNSFLGSGGIGTTIGGTVGAAGNNYGSGGAGATATTTGAVGGAGSQGCIIVYEYS